MSVIKAVIFDVGGVLIERNFAMWDDLKEEFGFDDKAMENFWQKYLVKFGSGKITEKELWLQASKELGIRPVLPDENLIGKSFIKTFKQYKEVLNYVKGLRKRGFKTIVLSNTNEVHSNHNRDQGTYEPFEHVFLSHEVGMRKPDPEIYEHTLEKIGVEPDQAIFIDDQEQNIEAAHKLGMHTVLAKNPKQIINDVEAALK